jgi:acyl-CoA reductase-like NAD-dependent aldehyde dehydrogenase
MDLALPAIDPSAPAPAAPPLDAPPPTPAADLDRAAAELAERAPSFASTPARERAALLRAVLPRLRDAAPEIAAIACRAKGVDPGSPAAGEEWIFGPDAVIAYVRLLAEALDDIASRGRPALSAAGMGRLPDGRLVASLAPRRWSERAALGGASAAVIFAEGVQPEDAIAAQAPAYRRAASEGVALVLGAGSASAPAPMDALHALFVEGKVTLLKTSPLAAALGPPLERALSPLVERGFLRVVHGGAEEGAHLAAHPAVTSVHLTGSAETFDALVWGPPGPEREARRAASDPALKKPVTAALGGVNPVMIVPSFYSKSELWYLARGLASAVAANAGCHCFAPRVLVLPARWPQRALLLDMLLRAFAQIPPRQAFHPGAAARHARLAGDRPGVLRAGAEGPPGTLPWTIVPSLDPWDPGEPLLATDPFCPVLSIADVGSDDPVEYLAEATRFCNDRLAGTLAAEIVVHPADEDDPTIEAALERAMVLLRYGALGINQWPGLLFAMGAPPWGGHPSTTLAAPGSGLGLGHDARMLGRVDKAVVRGPLHRPVRPPWFYDKRRARRIGERLAAFHAAPGVRRLAGVV